MIIDKSLSDCSLSRHICSIAHKIQSIRTFASPVYEVQEVRATAPASMEKQQITTSVPHNAEVYQVTTGGVSGTWWIEFNGESTQPMYIDAVDFVVTNELLKLQVL